MRPKERIPIFIRHVNIRQLITEWFKNMKIPTFSMNKAIKEITTKILYLTQYWQDNPNLRFSEVLVNTGLLPTIPGTWYYEEDHDILIKQGCYPRDITLWGRNFNKEGNRLPKTEWILIKDLSTNHIENILISEFIHLNDKYKKYFQYELKFRKNNDLVKNYPII